MELKNLYDLIIIGAGPAGLTAAIYMARARYKTLILEKYDVGGQINITNEIVNYPGIKNINGRDLTAEMAAQARAFGAEIKIDEVVDMELEGSIKKITTKNRTYHALTVIIATGANPRHIGFKGEEDYKGHGVAYCATCDGEFYTDKDIFIVGGGVAAAEEAMFLTRYAKSVTMLIRDSDFSCDPIIKDEVLNHKPKIDVLFNTEVKEIDGDYFPKTLIYFNNITGEETTYKCDDEFFGTFIFAGYKPNTKLVKDFIKLDEDGYVITDINNQTNIKGVFAAGDLCIKNLRQIVTAVSDGAIAATAAEKLAAKKHIELGIKNLFDVSRIDYDDDELRKVDSSESDEFITDEMKDQLKIVFSRFEKKLILVANVNKTPLAKEVKAFVSQIDGVSENLITRTARISDDQISFISLEEEDGSDTGYKFIGVPGGHEFTSFVLSIYNYSGKGQPMEDEQFEKIQNLQGKRHIDIVVSLSCTKCPDVVAATSQITGKFKDATLTVHDINYSEELREKYNIMSVPCMIINDETVVFGKKTLDEILEFI